MAGILVTSACGGDDDDNGEAAPTTTTAPADKNAQEPSGEFLHDEEYTAVLADSLEDSDSGFGASADEAACAVDRMVDQIGAQRMQEAGLTEENLLSDETTATDLTEEEANQVADALLECIDFASAVARSFSEDVAADEVSCLSDRLGDESLLRETIVASLLEGDNATIDDGTSQQLSDAFFECIDMAQLFIGELKAGGTQLTPEQEACLREAIAANPAVREAFAESFNGGDDSGEAIGAAVLSDLQRCAPGAFSQSE